MNILCLNRMASHQKCIYSGPH